MAVYEIFVNGVFQNRIRASETYVKKKYSKPGYSYIKIRDADNAKTIASDQTAMKIGELTNENVLLKAQIQALTNQNDFLEDCITEMAQIIYA